MVDQHVLTALRIGYVEFKTIELVNKAIGLSGTIVMGLPIMIQLTESERNKIGPSSRCVSFSPYTYHANSLLVSTSRLEYLTPTQAQCSKSAPIFSELELTQFQALRRIAAL